MFLTLYSQPRGGHPPAGREIIQAGQSHVLWRGQPDETYLYGLREAANLAAKAHQSTCTVVRVRDTGIERSYGAWWPYPLRRLDESLAKGWERNWTHHYFCGSISERALMIVGWAPKHERIVVQFEIPGCSTVAIDATYRDVQQGLIEDLVRDRGFRVIGESS